MAGAVLVRVWGEGAYAAAALDAELRRRPQLDRRDQALATELVYGVLRAESWLERQIDRHATRQTYKRQPAVRAAMLIGAYELLLLDRIPDHAAVSEAVGAARRAAGAKVGGFVNAVLRKVAAQRRTEPTATDVRRREAAVASVPRWLRKALTAVLPEEPDALERFLTARALPPPLGLCVAAGEERGAWAQRLAAELGDRASVDLGAQSPRALLVRTAGDVRRLPGHGDAWRVQEEGAQVLGLALGARPGERVLDACAGRGGKTLLLAEAVGPAGLVDAADRHPRKLDVLGTRGARVGSSFAVDWSRGTGDVPLRFYDRVLVDAPCSGTGTLTRRPEIARRLQPDDPPRLALLQQAIVRAAAACARDGARLVYAVCSPLGVETDLVVRALSEPAPGPRLRPAPFDSGDLPVAQGAERFRLWPHVHGTDAYFVASFTVHHEEA